MLALAIYEVGMSAPPRERGFYQGELAALEPHVKDTARFERGWAFYALGTARERADALPREAACYSCHAEHADQDNVFTQFYPILRGPESKNSPPH